LWLSAYKAATSPLTEQQFEHLESRRHQTSQHSGTSGISVVTEQVRSADLSEDNPELADGAACWSRPADLVAAAWYYHAGREDAEWDISTYSMEPKAKRGRREEPSVYYKVSENTNSNKTSEPDPQSDGGGYANRGYDGNSNQNYLESTSASLRGNSSASIDVSVDSESVVTRQPMSSGSERRHGDNGRHGYASSSDPGSPSGDQAHNMTSSNNGTAQTSLDDPPPSYREVVLQPDKYHAASTDVEYV
jgi:hypothetical protein